LGTEADDVVDRVQLKIEKSKIYKNLDILDELGISRSYVSRIEKRALMKLYHEFYKSKR